MQNAFSARATADSHVNSWLYLVTFNGLWVAFPVWILWEGYRAMSSAMSQAEMVDLVNYLGKGKKA